MSATYIEIVDDQLKWERGWSGRDRRHCNCTYEYYSQICINSTVAKVILKNISTVSLPLINGVIRNSISLELILDLRSNSIQL